MTEAIDWLDDGTPYSPRFHDRYRSSAHEGVEQARTTFLAGCGLPAAWAGQAQWRILETGFGLGLNFLVTWAAWRADPQRPRLLHFVSCEAWPVAAESILRAAPSDPELQALAQMLCAQYKGLLPGVHRLSFDQGRVLLTLYIGDAQALLRQERPMADSIYLDGFSPDSNPEMWSAPLCQALARCCHRGTRLATWSVARSVREALIPCGFEVQKVPGVAPKRSNLQATYNPAWQPRGQSPEDGRARLTPSDCIVVGGGLAGAAAAASLARRGWQVRVLDQGAQPASGASGLPVGVFAPHTSPDDAPLSRLTRAGIAMTGQSLQALLQEGVDWAASGVLEHCVDGAISLPAAWQASTEHPGQRWSAVAGADHIEQSGLPPGSAAQWHGSGGWVRPAQWVKALLQQPGITWQGGVQITRLTQTTDAQNAPLWQLHDANGEICAQAPLVVLATGAGSIALCEPFLKPQALRPLRGQVCWGLSDHCADLPPWPLNGHGNFVPHAPTAQGTIWSMGSTFERGQIELPKTPQALTEGRAAIAQRLQGLSPRLGQALGARIAQGEGAGVQSWAGVRCAAPDRRPVVGPLAPGLCVSTAMGARGLAHAMLCAEVLAATLHAEPLPIEAKLAQWLRAERLLRVALTGQVVSLDATPPLKEGQTKATGFVPFDPRGVVISNDVIDKLRDPEGV